MCSIGVGEEQAETSHSRLRCSQKPPRWWKVTAMRPMTVVILFAQGATVPSLGSLRTNMFVTAATQYSSKSGQCCRVKVRAVLGGIEERTHMLQDLQIRAQDVLQVRQSIQGTYQTFAADVVKDIEAPKL